MLTLFIFTYFEDERKKKIMMVFECERKRKFKKKLTKINILNKIFCKIDNLILRILKSEQIR